MEPLKSPIMRLTAMAPSPIDGQRPDNCYGPADAAEPHDPADHWRGGPHAWKLKRSPDSDRLTRTPRWLRYALRVFAACG